MDHIVRAVVLAYAKDVQPCFICQFGSSNYFLEPLLRSVWATRIGGQTSEGVDAEFRGCKSCIGSGR